MVSDDVPKSEQQPLPECPKIARSCHGGVQLRATSIYTFIILVIRGKKTLNLEGAAGHKCVTSTMKKMGPAS